MTPMNPVWHLESLDPDERSVRIVTAALEVFSEFSFRDATTDEIARRAHVSKRDIYSRFPDKHALLAAVIKMVLLAGNEKLEQVALLTREATSPRERLEVIGLALINEILSPTAGFVIRLIASESIDQPQIGEIYFSVGYARRSELISDILGLHIVDSGGRMRRNHLSQAASHFLALVMHLPQMTVLLGMRETWNSKSVQTHVKNALGLFFDAYPLLSKD
jgi:AcrR family transcriptional regulator